MTETPDEDHLLDCLEAGLEVSNAEVVAERCDHPVAGRTMVVLVDGVKFQVDVSRESS